MGGAVREPPLSISKYIAKRAHSTPLATVEGGGLALFLFAVESVRLIAARHRFLIQQQVVDLAD